MRIFVSSGTSKPAIFAMAAGRWPTIFALSAPLMSIVARILSASALLRKWQPRFRNSAFTAS